MVITTTPLRQAVLKGTYKKIMETELGLLHDAAVRDDSKMVRHVYKLDKSALDVKWHGRTALHDAALVGSCDAITALLNLGSDPAIRDTDGKQPFQLADKLTRRHFRKWSRRNDQRYACCLMKTWLQQVKIRVPLMRKLIQTMHHMLNLQSWVVGNLVN